MSKFKRVKIIQKGFLMIMELIARIFIRFLALKLHISQTLRELVIWLANWSISQGKQKCFNFVDRC